MKFIKLLVAAKGCSLHATMRVSKIGRRDESHKPSEQGLYERANPRSQLKPLTNADTRPQQRQGTKTKRDLDPSWSCACHRSTLRYAGTIKLECYYHPFWLFLLLSLAISRLVIQQGSCHAISHLNPRQTHCPIGRLVPAVHQRSPAMGFLMLPREPRSSICFNTVAGYVAPANPPLG